MSQLIFRMIVSLLYAGVLTVSGCEKRADQSPPAKPALPSPAASSGSTNEAPREEPPGREPTLPEPVPAAPSIDSRTEPSALATAETLSPPQPDSTIEIGKEVSFADLTPGNRAETEAPDARLEISPASENSPDSATPAQEAPSTAAPPLNPETTAHTAVVPTEPPALPRLTGLRVALDVGHSVQAPGAASARGRGEFYFNQATARIVAARLSEAGAHVTIINDKGTVADLVERTILASKIRADAFISIHHDSCHDKYKRKWTVEGRPQEYCDDFSGYSVFCSEKNPLALVSRELAKALGASMLNEGFHPTPHHHEPIQGENRPFIDEATGVYEFTDLVVAKRTEMPAALLECGVIVNRDEELAAQTPEYQSRIATAVVRALGHCIDSGLFERERKISDLPLSPTPTVRPSPPESALPPPATEEERKKKGLIRRIFDGKKK